MLELAVLGLLKEQPLHGYELKKRLGETLGFLWGVSYGSLYPALRRLERDGAIEIVLEPTVPTAPSRPPARSPATSPPPAEPERARIAKATRRTRKAYRITELGDRHFIELLLADDAPADDEKAFALQLAFCGHLPARPASSCSSAAASPSSPGSTAPGAPEPSAGRPTVR